MSSSERISLSVTDPPPPPQRGGAGEQSIFKGSSMTSRGVYAAVSYMSCAVMLVLFNKAALSSYSFPCANVITLFQMTCSCSFLYALRCWKLISFSSGDTLPLTDNSTRFVPLKTVIRTSPLALTYLLYMLAAMESVRGVNVPMYTTLRRTTVVFTMFVEFILVGQKYSRSIIGRKNKWSQQLWPHVVQWNYLRTSLTSLDIHMGRLAEDNELSIFVFSRIYGCIASILHTRFFLKLLDLPEHDSQFSSHADDLW